MAVMKAATGNKAYFCMPKGTDGHYAVNNGQSVDIQITNLRDNPEARQLDASVLLLTALGRAYPCRST